MANQEARTTSTPRHTDRKSLRLVNVVVKR